MKPDPSEFSSTAIPPALYARLVIPAKQVFPMLHATGEKGERTTARPRKFREDKVEVERMSIVAWI